LCFVRFGNRSAVTKVVRCLCAFVAPLPGTEIRAKMGGLRDACTLYMFRPFTMTLLPQQLYRSRLTHGNMRGLSLELYRLVLLTTRARTWGRRHTVFWLRATRRECSPYRGVSSLVATRAAMRLALNVACAATLANGNVVQRLNVLSNRQTTVSV
jgi:hypothetical protein